MLALWLVRSGVPDRRRSLGLVIGFAGVVALLGIDVRGDAADLLGAGAVILGALGYAGAALLYRRWLLDAPAVAVTALMTAISGVVFLGPPPPACPGRYRPRAASRHWPRSGSSTPASLTGFLPADRRGRGGYGVGEIDAASAEAVKGSRAYGHS